VKGDITVHFDGAAHPNPGLASWGFTIDVPGQLQVRKKGMCPGDERSNNEAEYIAMGMALRYVHDHATELAGHRLVVLGDSQLVIRQMTGKYQCNEKLSPLLNRAKQVCKGIEVAGFPPIIFEHIPGEQNPEADRLSKEAWEEFTGQKFPVYPKKVKKWA